MLNVIATILFSKYANSQPCLAKVLKYKLNVVIKGAPVTLCQVVGGMVCCLAKKTEWNSVSWKYLDEMENISMAI